MVYYKLLIMKITLRLINALKPCYDPLDVGFTEEMSLTPLEFIDQFTDKVVSQKNIIWLLCRKQFMDEKALRSFTIWCAREALNLIESPDEKSLNVLKVAEDYIKEKVSKKELKIAAAAADTDTAAAADACAAAAAVDACAAAATYAAHRAVYGAGVTKNNLIGKLKEWFETEDIEIFFDNKINN